jgi:RNA polymerase sigma-70 factor (ECF subfamily)
LTQDFFARFLEKNYLAGVDPRKGKFRSFLLASLKHFLANEWDRRQAAKRGGGQAHIPLDELTAENLYRLEPTHDFTAEKVFERRWALTLLEQTLTRLRDESASVGRSALFDALKIYLTGEKAVVSQAEVAARLRMSEGAVKVAVHRLRQRYRDLIREEIAQTVAGPEEVDEELQHLLAALRP